MREHAGRLAIRLPADAQILLDPGYLLLDLPALTEQERSASWSARPPPDPITDPDDLAARYRIGPLMEEHIERAIRMEFREIGKLAESGVLE